MAAAFLVTMLGAGATDGVRAASGATTPTVTSVSPNTGPVAGGTSVTISGTGFTSGSVVYFGTTVAQAVYVNTSTLTVVSPAGSGTVDVTVATTTGISVTTSADQYTYAPFPVPQGGSPSLPFYDSGSSRVGWNPCSSSSPCDNLNSNAAWVSNGNWYFSLEFVAPEAGTYVFQKFLAGSAAIAYIDGQAVAITSNDTPAQPNYFTTQLSRGTHLLAFQVVNNSSNHFAVPCATTCGQSWGTGLDFLLIDPAGNVVAEDVGYCDTHMCPDLAETNQYELWFPPIPPPGAITSGTLSAGFGGGSAPASNGGSSPGSPGSAGGDGSGTTGGAASAPAPAASEQPTVQLTEEVNGLTVVISGSLSANASITSGSISWDDSTAPQAIPTGGSGFALTHQYHVSGTYTVTVQVLDSGGQTASGSETVPVSGPTGSSAPAASSGPGAGGLPGGQPTCPQGFTDVGGYEWAANDISILAGQGIVEGLGDCAYDPGGMVTKAQFAALVTRIFNLQFPANPQPFTDVPPSSWEYQSVEAAATYMPFLSQIGGGSAFYPRQPMDRQDVAATVVNILDQTGKLTMLSPSQAAAILTGIPDASDIASGLRGQVAAAIANHILIGFPDGSFQPLGLLNRAQIAVVLVRLENEFITTTS